MLLHSAAAADDLAGRAIEGCKTSQYLTYNQNRENQSAWKAMKERVHGFQRR